MSVTVQALVVDPVKYLKEGGVLYPTPSIECGQQFRIFYLIRDGRGSFLGARFPKCVSVQKAINYFRRNLKYKEELPKRFYLTQTWFSVVREPLTLPLKAGYYYMLHNGVAKVVRLTKDIL